MTFILRLPSILVLLALSLMSFAGALGAAGVITGYEAPFTQAQQAQTSAAESGAAEATWLDVGLLAGAGLLFLVSAIRLVRRTQGFWAWLLGFACYGGRWAMAQEGDIVEMVRGIDPTAYLQPRALIADTASPEVQIGLLGIILILGVIIFIIDAADRAYWDRQGA